MATSGPNCTTAVSLRHADPFRLYSHLDTLYYAFSIRCNVLKKDEDVVGWTRD
ncbi:hypothetical protein EJ02DRAFT_437801 [Clathrospora elynae]|uniref:Uncharacterized protein n=1 Tax=Clathrospora elynae TaxID=706981 RepID=A0A6A5SDA3_9PLEO|nr:hypothetical protein EJ02DRAFT_437801 [Clathrospora elynae]